MENKLTIAKTYRYFTHGNPKTASHIWFVLHGYGQLPAFFIRKFQTLDPEKHFVVAPEGMHRFYLEGTSGRVGASWMTKESREDDIKDNHNFLNQLKETFLSKYNFNTKVLLGFSQGGATASRWHETGNFNADHFILWASVFPPDLQLPKKENAFANSDNHFVIGNQDQYFDKEKVAAMEAHLKAHSLTFKTLKFEGDHNIPKSALEKIVEIVGG